MAWFDPIFRFINRASATLHEADHGDEDLATLDEQHQAAPPADEWRVDSAGWLQPKGKRIVHVPTVRTSKLVTKGPVMIVWHWTATSWGTAATIAKRTATYDAKKDRAASMHALIEHDGVLTQLAPAIRGTWCQGGATAQRFSQDPTRFAKGQGPFWVPTDKGVSANALAFSFELVNLGEVRMVNGKWRAWPFEPTSPSIREEDMKQHGRRFYHRFTEAQVDSAALATRALVRAYGLRREDCLRSHQQIDPTRKSDPGPLWMEVHLVEVLDRAFRG